MLASDFAAASVLISFGVIIGKTSPLQLIVMGIIEIVVFVANEVIGRSHFGVNTFALLNPRKSIRPFVGCPRFAKS